MKKGATRQLALFSMLLAIELILVISPLGYIPVGVVNVTTMHIPVILAGILLGKRKGAQLGFVFGMTSLIMNTIRPLPTSFVFTPFLTIGSMQGNWASLLIVFIPRILLGYVSGMIFELFSKRSWNQDIVVAICAICGAFTNTILVLTGIYIFYGEAYAQVIQTSYDVLLSVLITSLSVNGVLEAIIGMICSIVVYKAIATKISS